MGRMMLHSCNILSHQAQTAAILLVAFSLGITGIAAHVPGSQDKDPHKGDFCVDISRYEHIAVNETWKEVGTLEAILSIPVLLFLVSFVLIFWTPYSD